MPNKIREVRKSRGMTLEELAGDAGISTSYLSRIEKGGDEPDGRGLSLENAVRIARALKCEITDFTSDFSEDDIAAASHMTLRTPRRDDTGDVANLTIHAGMGSVSGLEAVEGDGDSGFVPSAFTNGYWTFPQAIRDRFRNITHTHALPVLGDSMTPTLIDGAVVFVDTTHLVPSPPDLYAVDYGDGLMVKRVELVPRTKKVRIISDNDKYQTHTLNREELKVFGRVVAWFQWRG